MAHRSLDPACGLAGTRQGARSGRYTSSPDRGPICAAHGWRARETGRASSGGVTISGGNDRCFLLPDARHYTKAEAWGQRAKERGNDAAYYYMHVRLYGTGHRRGRVVQSGAPACRPPAPRATPTHRAACIPRQDAGSGCCRPTAGRWSHSKALRRRAARDLKASNDACAIPGALCESLPGVRAIPCGSADQRPGPGKRG